jgi:rhodanese-related sulfurtransferase
MKKLLSIIILFFTVLISFNAYADSRVTEVSVSSVQAFVSDHATNVAIFDANDEDTRNKKGTVPGAIKLSSYNEYALSELPSNKATTLIFYCYNTLCPASHMAAERAVEAGYKDVRVMKAGIIGWLEATKK